MSYSIDITNNPNFWNNYRLDFLTSADTKSLSLVDGLMLHLYKTYKAKLTTIVEGSTMIDHRYAIVFESEADATMFVLRWS